MREFWRKLTRLDQRDELARRLREELEFHVEMKVSQSGLTANRARCELGNQARILEEANKIWSFPFIEHIWSDCRHAARVLLKSPAFFILVATGTGLGVAAITAVSSVADVMLIRALPYRDSGRLMVIWDQLLNLGFSRFPVSNANYLVYRAQNHVFEDVAAFEPRAVTVAFEDRAERAPGMFASSNLLSVLGGSMERGRWFEVEENYRGRSKSVVLSHRFWQRRFGGRNLIDKLIRLDDVPYSVVGVLKDGFDFRLSGEAPDLWLPVGLDIDPGNRDIGNLCVIGRLQAGVTAASAQGKMRMVAADLKRRYRVGMGPNGEDGGYETTAIPLREELHGASRPTLYALAGASGILLALGFANTAVLWLGRAARRRQEAAVRLALGASRARVGQQLIIEALIPWLAGGALAFALSLGGLRALNVARLAEFATVTPFAVDYRVLGISLLLSACVGILACALPLKALFRPGTEGQVVVQDRGGIGDRSEGRFRTFLIALQVGLSCALLVPSLLLVESLAALERVNPGFRTRDLLTAYVSVPRTRAPTPASIVDYYKRLEEKLVAWRGFSNVTMMSSLPLTLGPGGDPFSIEGHAYGSSGSVPQFAHPVQVGQNYFSLMNIRILSGREFEARDFAVATNVAIVSESLAKAFWPHESPVGQRILMGAPRPGAAWMTIVGTAADIHAEELGRVSAPQIYLPFPQAPSRTMALVIGGPGAGAANAAGLVRVLGAADPGVPGYGVRTMAQHVAETLERPRFRTTLFAAYSLLASALAAYGAYSVAVYLGIRRRREFAVRSALGASGQRLFGAMLWGTLRPAGMGVAVGLGVAYPIARTMGTFLYRTKSSDIGAYLGAGFLTLAVALLAGGFGGRGALENNSVEILREG